MAEAVGLAQTLKDINKQYGAGTIVQLSDHKASIPVNVISTGNKIIDDLTGINGVPRGRVVEVYGPEAGGKTTLCLQIIAEAQKMGGVAAIIDAEHALNIDYAQQVGVDTDKLLMTQPDNGEEALEIARMLIESGGVTVVVIDSVAALVPRAELEGEMGDAQMGLQARLMSQAMRKITHAVKTTDTCLIFINQTRDKIGVMFGSPETTTGGKALKFYASLRIDIRRISQIKKADVIIGQNVKVKIVKNKFAAPYRDAELPLVYGRGLINPEGKK